MPLSESDIEKLEELLFSDELVDETLDYFGFHGLVCASVIGPKHLNLDQITQVVFASSNPSCLENQPDHLDHLRYCVEMIESDLLDSFDENSEPSLPYEQEEEIDACLQSWCVGFIEGFFCYEDLWFKENEEIAAELLMPIMVLSGLFEETELAQIQSNERVMAQFETIIPDQLTNIFLYYKTK